MVGIFAGGNVVVGNVEVGNDVTPKIYYKQRLIYSKGARVLARRPDRGSLFV